jgi:hypothetical protein
MDTGFDLGLQCLNQCHSTGNCLLKTAKTGQWAEKLRNIIQNLMSGIWRPGLGASQLSSPTAGCCVCMCPEVCHAMNGKVACYKGHWGSPCASPGSHVQRRCGSQDRSQLANRQHDRARIWQMLKTSGSAQHLGADAILRLPDRPVQAVLGGLWNSCADCMTNCTSIVRAARSMKGNLKLMLNN